MSGICRVDTVLSHIASVLQLRTSVMADAAERSQVFQAFIAGVLVGDVVHLFGCRLAEHAELVVELKPRAANALPLVARIVDP